MCETDKSHKYFKLEKKFKTKKTVNSNTFLIALSMKSRARTFPAVLASSPVKRPIPAPSSSTDFPSYGGSKDRIYRKGIQPCQYVSPESPGTASMVNQSDVSCILNLQSFFKLLGHLVDLYHTVLGNKIEQVQLLNQRTL